VNGIDMDYEIKGAGDLLLLIAAISKSPALGRQYKRRRFRPPS